jgi:hypothetical protein
MIVLLAWSRRRKVASMGAALQHGRFGRITESDVRNSLYKTAVPIGSPVSIKAEPAA